MKCLPYYPQEANGGDCFVVSKEKKKNKSWPSLRLLQCQGSEGTKKLPEEATLHTTMGDITFKLFSKE